MSAFFSISVCVLASFWLISAFSASDCFFSSACCARRSTSSYSISFELAALTIRISAVDTSDSVMMTASAMQTMRLNLFLDCMEVLQIGLLPYTFRNFRMDSKLPNTPTTKPVSA